MSHELATLPQGKLGCVHAILCFVDQNYFRLGMLTDTPPRNANRAGFLESDRIKTVDPASEWSFVGDCPASAIRDASGENSRRAKGLRRVSGGRLRFLRSSELWHASAGGETSASPRELDDRALWRLQFR